MQLQKDMLHNSRKLSILKKAIVTVRAETNIQFTRIFARLHNYSNTMKVFRYTTNDFGIVILVYLLNTYIFEAISVIQ